MFLHIANIKLYNGSVSGCTRTGWVGQVHIFWKRFRPPWSSILETLGETAILKIQTDKKGSSEIKKIKESSFWWRWRELNPRPKPVQRFIVHKISSLNYQ